MSTPKGLKWAPRNVASPPVSPPKITKSPPVSPPKITKSPPVSPPKITKSPPVSPHKTTKSPPVSLSRSNNIIRNNIDDVDNLIEIKETFKLNLPPFDDIDPDFLLLAFTPSCGSGLSDKSFLKKFGTCNHQQLEFYGDRFLYAVMADLSYELFGFRNTPGFLTNFMSFSTKNETITNLMLQNDACELVRLKEYSITNNHNSCGDTFEALIGVLYFHLKSKKLDPIEGIKDWLFDATNLPFLIKKYLDDVNTDNKGIFINETKDYTSKRLIRREIELLSGLDSEDNLDAIKDLVKENYQPSKFATKSLLVNDNDTVAQIYAKLKWQYEEPIIDEDGYYNFYGYSDNIKTIIGIGRTKDKAFEEGIRYLIDFGYIIPFKSSKKYSIE